MNVAPALPTSCGSLPPEGALRLRPGKAGSAALAWEEGAPTLPTSCGSLPPEEAAAPAVWQNQSRGPYLGVVPPWSIASRHCLPARSDL